MRAGVSAPGGAELAWTIRNGPGAGAYPVSGMKVGRVTPFMGGA